MLVCRICLREPYYQPSECLECDNCGWFVDGKSEMEARLDAIMRGYLISDRKRQEERLEELPEGCCF